MLTWFNAADFNGTGSKHRETESLASALQHNLQIRAQNMTIRDTVHAQNNPLAHRIRIHVAHISVNTRRLLCSNGIGICGAIKSLENRLHDEERASSTE